MATGGFMAGFGSAFADSFHQDQDQKANERQDQFRLQYSDYISQRDYRQKMDLENKKNLRLARSLVAAAPNQPPEAADWAYQTLSAGGDPSYVAKQLSENQAIVTSGNTTKPGAGATASDAQPADPRADLSNAAAGSVDGQMKAAGMQAPQDGGLFGGVKQGLHDVFSSEGRTQRNAAVNQKKIAGMSGVPEQQVQDTLAGKNMPGAPIDGQPDAQISWTPKGQTFQAMDDKANNLGDAQALQIWAEAHGTPEQKAYAANKFKQFKELKSHEIAQNAYNLDPSKAPQRGMVRKADGTGYENYFVTATYPDGDPLNPVYTDDKGNVVDSKLVAPVGMSQENDIKAVTNEASDDMKPYEQAKTDQKTFIRTANDYIKLLKDTNGKYDGKAMDISGNVTQFIDRWRRAGVNIADLVMPKGNIEDATTAIGELDAAEKTVRDQLASGKIIDAVAVNAAKASLIDIQGTKLAYQMAAQANGSTRGISNQDFQKFKDVVSGNGNPATAAKALAQSIQQGNSKLGDMEGGIKKGRGAAANYKGKYKNAPTGFDMGSGFNDEIQSDPELSDAMKNILAGASEENNPGQQMDTTISLPDWAQKSGKPVVGLDGQDVTPGMWKYMSPALQEAIKKKNGL